MSSYLANLVQRSAITGSTGAVGPASVPAMHTELLWRPTTRPAAEAVDQTTSSIEAAATDTDTDTATATETTKSRPALHSPAIIQPSEPQPDIHDAVSALHQAETAQIVPETESALPASTHTQTPTPTSVQVLPAMSDPTPAVVSQRAENKRHTSDADVANIQSRAVSPEPPDAIVQPSPATSTVSLSAARPANGFHPPGQSVNSSQLTDVPEMTRTVMIDASDHAELKPSMAAMPVMSQQTKTLMPQAIVPALAPALRLPAAGPVNRSGQNAAQQPADVQVRIGKVEVRAAPVQQTPAAVAPANAGARGFDDYISMRTYTRDNY